MKITVNGETVETQVWTVSALLRELGIEPGRVAVEVNLSIIKRKDFDAAAIKEGDSVEIVNFVGGGGLWKTGW